MDAEFRAIREEEREACLDLWCTVFPGAGRDYFRRYFYGDVEWLPYYTQVAVLDGKLVSSVHICKRVVACGDFQLTMGGIANVATLPEHRGQGYNTECLRRAVGIMEADAMDFSLLGTGINAFYERVGFATLHHDSLYGPIRADFAPRPTPVVLRPATAADLPTVQAIYAEYNRQRPYTVQRTEAYWRDWVRVSPERIPETLLVATLPDGTVQGYVRYHLSDRDVADVTELGVRTADADTLTSALLEAVAERARAAQKAQLHFGIAQEPDVAAAARTILAEENWYTHKHDMVRLLHRENLLRAVALGLNERWIAAGRPGGALTFETPYGPVRLDANGTFLRAEPVEEATEALGQAMLFVLLFGLTAPEQAMTDTALHPLLAALFPRRPAIYWNADGF
jgi:N-acetylglutamate synthase-like GNAT family acetyltransferase